MYPKYNRHRSRGKVKNQAQNQTAIPREIHDRHRFALCVIL